MISTRVFDTRLVLYRRPGRHKHTRSVDCGYRPRPQWSQTLVIAATLTLFAAIAVPSGAQAAYVQQWARGTTGTAEHQFEGPEGIAVASGKVFVSDFGNARIEVFNGFGAFQYMWGVGVQDGFPMFESCTSSCRAGIAGAANGQFRYPAGLAATSGDDVYVADSQNHRIQRFTAGGLGARSPGAASAPPTGSSATRSTWRSILTAASMSPTPTTTGSRSSTPAARS